MLIGRDAELAGLTDALVSRRPILIVGEPGVGKTALLRAAAAASPLITTDSRTRPSAA